MKFIYDFKIAKDKGWVINSIKDSYTPLIYIGKVSRESIGDGWLIILYKIYFIFNFIK